MTRSEAPAMIVQGVPTSPDRSGSIDRYANSTDLYPVKAIKFSGINTVYLLQGPNGPCPLLAIANVLLLKGVLTVPDGSVDVSFDWLTGQLGNWMMDHNSGPEIETSRGSSLDDCVSVLGYLNKGLEVNVRFTSVDGFDDTRETRVFKNLGVSVFHGWIVSEDDLSAYPHVSGLSYNDAVEKVALCEEIKSRIVANGDFESANQFRETLQEGEAIANWLSQTSSQLTTDGIIQLNARMESGGIAVLFRNNHFLVIHKREDRLFSLVTDVGFRGTSVVWESLDQVDGDSEYFTESFSRVSPGRRSSEDYTLAVRLQFEEDNRVSQVVADATPPPRRRKKKCTIM